MALSQLSYAGLFIGMLLVMFTFRFIAAAYQGLMALVGQEKLMSGRLSVLWNIVSSHSLYRRRVRLGLGRRTSAAAPDLHADGGASALLIGALRASGSRARCSSHAYDGPGARRRISVGDIKRLVRHRAVYPAVLIMFMFQFSPGSNTPLQYYLTNTLHASDAIYGDFYGDLRRLLHPGVFPLRLAVQAGLAGEAAVVGHDHHRAADGSAGLHPLRRPGAVAGGADRA